MVLHEKKTVCLLLAFCCGISQQSKAADLPSIEDKVSVCFGCHGKKGKSPNPLRPSLTGQPAVYIINQLNAFKTGSRINSLMEAQANSMSDEEMASFAAYFANQQPRSAGDDLKLTQANRSKVESCLGCHGSTAQGDAGFPRLAGLPSAYLIKQLEDFKSGIRKNITMQNITASLSGEDMKMLAAYFESL